MVSEVGVDNFEKKKGRENFIGGFVAFVHVLMIFSCSQNDQLP